MEKCSARSAIPLCVRRAENATKLRLRVRIAFWAAEVSSRSIAVTMTMKHGDQTQNNYENMNPSRIPCPHSVITGPRIGKSDQIACSPQLPISTIIGSGKSSRV